MRKRKVQFFSKHNSPVYRGYEKTKGRGTHWIKEYFNSSELGVLSTTANSNLGWVHTGTGYAIREEQKQDFDLNQDSVPRYS